MEIVEGPGHSSALVPWTRLMHYYPDEVRWQYSAPSPWTTGGGGTAYSAYMMRTVGQCPCGWSLLAQASSRNLKWYYVSQHEARVPCWS